jgi:hypothetical protein
VPENIVAGGRLGFISSLNLKGGKKDGVGTVWSGKIV